MFANTTSMSTKSLSFENLFTIFIIFGFLDTLNILLVWILISVSLSLIFLVNLPSICDNSDASILNSPFNLLLFIVWFLPLISNSNFSIKFTWLSIFRLVFVFVLPSFIIKYPILLHMDILLDLIFTISVSNSDLFVLIILSNW